ncbi:hypothetical protein KFE25_002611 [Diacronema lutheri]|uniref:Response regulatory domain-containing protein n=3 Tax=Diacronema lutheri TaxID=2081491 RepID=A0A8J5XRK8_DIALT|nr:hypothetical protein KFE25_002611 [Diacronema lutheri]
MASGEGVAVVPAEQHPRSVLVVDDSGVCRARLKAMCKRLYPGVEIAQAIDGDAAVVDFERRLRQGTPFDAVLMDLNMVGDDDRPQLTGMLDERNGPQASARIRRAELAAAHDSGAPPGRAIVIVITGSTRTDRWDLAYYHGCGIDGFLSKPVSMAALSTAVAQTLIKARRPGRAGPGVPGESPLFGLSSAEQIDMYIEPALLEKAGQGGGDPMGALDAIGSHMFDGLSAQLDNAVRDAGIVPRRASTAARAAAAAPGAPDAPPAARGALAALRAGGETSPTSSPLPPTKHTTRMAPRLPRRVPGTRSGFFDGTPGGDADGAAVAIDDGGDGNGGAATSARPPAPVRASRPGGAIHFLIVNAEPIMLMTQTALIQSISLEHAITRAGDADEAIAKLRTGAHGPVDVLLIGPVMDEASKVDAPRTARAVQAVRRHETGQGLVGTGSARPPLIAFAVTSSAAVVATADAAADAARQWDTEAVLKMPLRKVELLQAVSRALQARGALPKAPLVAAVDDSVLLAASRR